jgi:hypothetical protein
MQEPKTFVSGFECRGRALISRKLTVRMPAIEIPGTSDRIFTY